MPASLVGKIKALWPLAGWLYVVSLAFQPPPIRWVALACLVVLTPVVAGWVAGSVAGVGPWADDE